MIPPFLRLLALLLLVVLNGHGRYRQIPAHVSQGERVEQQFRQHRERLALFFEDLKKTIERTAPELLPTLAGPPPRPVVFGYQRLPRLIDEKPDADDDRLEARTYSWPLTAGYVAGEVVKLDSALATFNEIQLSDNAPRDRLAELAREYRSLVANQRTIDQFVQYNRFWQRAIAADRQRFDQMTEVYRLLSEGQRDLNRIIREALGKPDVPTFVRIDRSSRNETVVVVPMYTDVESEDFLAVVKKIIEDYWRVEEQDHVYRVRLDLRRVSTATLFKDSRPPSYGERIDLRAHAARFPSDGAVLTTGAESTHALVARYIALGSNDVSYRTLAHEFGHVLGFRDGYVRGYRDLGGEGFEILERVPDFDDIMSAPRSGSVQVTHFKLLLGN